MKKNPEYEESEEKVKLKNKEYLDNHPAMNTPLAKKVREGVQKALDEASKEGKK